jgi:hypothetical protein
MRTFTIKSFRGGISDFEETGILGAYKFGSNIDPRKRRDTISCQQTILNQVTSDNGGVWSGLANFIVDGADGNTYAFTNDGKIYMLVGSTWTLKYTDADGAIKGAAQWWQQDGNAYLFWTTDTKLKSKQIPGNTGWSDVNADIVVGSTHYTYPKTNLTSATWHTMAIANGALQICNSNYMAEVGYDGSYTTQVVNLIPGNAAKTVIERLGNVAIGTTRTTNAESGTLFEYIATALTWTKSKAIPAKGINGIVDTEVTLMQAGTNGGLYYTDFINMLPVTTVPGGGQCAPGGCDGYHGMALFGMYGNSTQDGNVATGIYSYGRLRKNAKPVLNLEYVVDADVIGAVHVSNGNIYVSYTKSSVNKMAVVDTSNKANGIWQSLDLDFPIGLPDETNICTISQVETLDMPAGTAIECWYRLDKKGSFQQAYLEGGATQFVADGVNKRSKAQFNIQSDGRCIEIMLKLFPSGNNTPEVRKVVLYFDP